MNPAVMNQLASQASPEDESVPPLLRKQRMLSPVPQPPAPMIPPPPKVIPVQTGNQPYTAQPTVTPVGATPQESVPQQPSFMYGRPTKEHEQMLKDSYNELGKFNDAEFNREYNVGKIDSGNAISLHQDEISKLKAGLEDYQNRDQGINTTPLAALLDARYGGHLAEAAQAQAPQTPAQKAAMTAEMQGKIAAAQGEIPKEQRELLATMLAQQNYGLNRAEKAQAAKAGIAEKLIAADQMAGTQAARLAGQADRLDSQHARIAAQAMSKIDTHPSMVQMNNQLNQIDLDKHTLSQYKGDPKGVPITVLNELFQGVGSAIGGGKGAGLGQTERNDVRNASTKWANFKQGLEPGVEAINDPEILNLAESTLNRLGESYENNSYLTAKKLGVGASSAYARQPLALKAINDKIESLRPGNRAKMQADFMPPSQEEIAAEIARRGLGK